MEKAINSAIHDKEKVQFKCQVYKAGDEVPEIKNVAASGGSSKTAIVQVGDLIIRYIWIRVGNS